MKLSPDVAHAISALKRHNCHVSFDLPPHANDLKKSRWVGGIFIKKFAGQIWPCSCSSTYRMGVVGTSWSRDGLGCDEIVGTRASRSKIAGFAGDRRIECAPHRGGGRTKTE